MSIERLRGLARTYSDEDRESLLQLSRSYEARREREILDIAAVAADVSIDSILNLGLESQGNPAVREAFALQYPNVDPASLVGRSAVELGGFARAVKGKLFEVLVRDRLNEGE